MTIKIFIDRPLTTAMLYLALSILGVYSFLNTPIELAPVEDYPKVDILSAWPGAPPEVVQTQVTAPVEEACSGIRGVQKMTSTSQAGRSTVTLEFHPRTNMEFAVLSLREELAKKRDALPPDVKPVVEPFVPEGFRVRPFLEFTISGTSPLQELSESVRDRLEIGLGSVKGVARAEMTGGPELGIKVLLDRERMNAYGLHPYQVNDALSRRLRVYPSGRVLKGGQEFLIKFDDRTNSPKELEDIVVASSGGHGIRIGDIATVAQSQTDIMGIHRINGRPTVSLMVARQRGENSLKVSGDVKRALEKIRAGLPRDLVFKTVNDECAEIRKNLRDLCLQAVIIAALVFAMVFVTLGRFAPAFLILSSIAFSLVITFNVIYALGISLNMLTLGALALSFGIVVDNSIVVFENILRLRARGLAPREASLEGPREVFTAVLASTLTTTAVFSSFPFFQGKLKIYYLPLALVMASAMASSLFVSFSLIPAIGPILVRRKKSNPRLEKNRLRSDRFLKFFLAHPLPILLGVTALFFGAYRWFRSEVVIGRWDSWHSRAYLYVRIGMPPGTDIARTDETVRAFEDKVMAQDYQTEMNTRIRPERADVIIEFPPEIERSRRPLELKEELVRLATRFAGLDIGVGGFDPQYYASAMNAGRTYGSRIRLSGYNLEKLKKIARDLERSLRRNPRVKDVKMASGRFGRERGDAFEDVLKIDKTALGRHDVDPAFFFSQLQARIQGSFGIPARIRSGGREVKVSVKFPEEAALEIKGLREELIRTRGEGYLRLGEIATFDEMPIAGAIERENQRFEQTIMWEFRGPAKTEEMYRDAVLSGLDLPPGFSAAPGDQEEMTPREKGEITFAFIAALALIFMILAALYESFLRPFLIMIAVPLALAGVFVAFIVADAPFDPTAYIGVILLAGIVVNNAILLVDRIHRLQGQGASLIDAVIRGTQDRVRPIFMTTGTTVLGVLPLLFVGAGTGKRQIWSSLALCTAGGLTSSTALILIVIPVVYFHVERLRAAAKGRAVKPAGPQGR